MENETRSDRRIEVLLVQVLSQHNLPTCARVEARYTVVHPSLGSFKIMLELMLARYLWEADPAKPSIRFMKNRSFACAVQ